MAKTIVFRNTAAAKGRNIIITPGNADYLEYLSMGRILLDAAASPCSWQSGENEEVLLCLHGAGTVTVNGAQHNVSPYDAVYVPKGSDVTVSTSSSIDLLENIAPVSKQYEQQTVRFDAVKDDPKLHLSIGPETMHRELFQVVSENVRAGRLMCGVTFSNKGNWTSWPPHEHIATLEEIYLFFDMPAPALGLQFAYTNREYPDVVIPVRENDAVVVSGGYHPNVSVPGHAINFVWILCAKREEVDRKWGVVNVQPEFKS